MAAEDAMPLEAPSDGSRQRPPGSFDEFSAYPPIADYGFMSDCEVAALVAPSGSVEWMCLPTMDGPSIFGAMLDRDAGWFRFGPDDVTVPSDRRYLPGTM
ncbi:MAG TPA: trehalase-like domain-containing protein, partial [Streptosporangiaceae bacterium]